MSKKAAKQLKAANCEPKVVDMADVSPDDLKAVENLLLITSTYGEGEPPDNAMSLHGALMADGAPEMAGVNFSVLGLGDSSYPDFCQCSKEFDARLEALGATRFAPMVECDGDPDEPFAGWIADVQKTLGDASAPAAPVEDAAEESRAIRRRILFPQSCLKRKTSIRRALLNRHITLKFHLMVPVSTMRSAMRLGYGRKIIVA